MLRPSNGEISLFPNGMLFVKRDVGNGKRSGLRAELDDLIGGLLVQIIRVFNDHPFNLILGIIRYEQVVKGKINEFAAIV